MYKYNHSEQLTSDIKHSVLFSKKQQGEAPQVLPELNRAVQLEHVRDYVYKMDRSEYKNDYVLALGSGSESAQYLPYEYKITMQKKQKRIERS